MDRVIDASGVALVLTALFAPPAAADPPGSEPVLGQLRGLPRAILTGGFGGGHSGARGPHGWFLGADTGWTWLVGGSRDVVAREVTDTRSNAWCFGARGGYQLASGLAVQARYDHLGVDSPDGSGALSFVSAGVRYAFPMEVEPFAEAMVGPALHGSTTSPGAALSVGLSVLASRHVAFDLAARDLLVDIGGVNHIPSITLGITAGYGG